MGGSACLRGVIAGERVEGGTEGEMCMEEGDSDIWDNTGDEEAGGHCLFIARDSRASTCRLRMVSERERLSVRELRDLPREVLPRVVPRLEDPRVLPRDRPRPVLRDESRLF